ncbi:spore germination protein [Paenibacillus chartarius]|uniref:Spore germination protein n=2 Tax=Paenibacillus chartarius TaxID=747481 RepID=A0ABV6DP34_9BACL
MKNCLTQWFQKRSSPSASLPAEQRIGYSNDACTNNDSGLTEQEIIGLFRHSADVKHFYCQSQSQNPKSSVLLLYCEGLTDQKEWKDIVLPRLRRLFRITGFNDEAMTWNEELPLEKVAGNGLMLRRQIVQHVLDGKLILFMPVQQRVYTWDMAKTPQRKPDESNIETSVKGPKDGFVEEVATNVALIRKRMRTGSLCYEQFTVGERTQTRIALLYLQDVANAALVDNLRTKLQDIEYDGICSAGQLQEMISSPKSIFPVMAYTGRPDFAVASLLSGRCAILTEGSPAALIAPADIFLLLKTAEDIHFPALTVAVARGLRLAGLLIALLLPALWTALLSFHIEQIPVLLLATISIQRVGLPFSVAQEMFLTLIFLEAFREAGARLPASLGQTMTVVGGLIIGDAAIRAGFMSPSVLVIGAITHVFGSMVPNHSLNATVSILRFGLFFVSAAFGIYGFLCGVVLLLSYLSTVQSFGLPYLSPLSPLDRADLPHALFKLPWAWQRKRPNTVNTQDSTRKGGEGLP